MGTLIWTVILVLMVTLGHGEAIGQVGQIGQVGIEEERLPTLLPSLDELKESAIKNNIEVVCKRQEIDEYKMSNSILNNIKGVSSYNFESDTAFYGVMIAIPLPFYFSYKRGLELKKSELEKVKQGVIAKLERLYYEYCNLCERLEVIEKEVADKKSYWNNISVCKDVIEAEKAYRDTELRLTKVERELKNVRSKIEVAITKVKEREINLNKLEKLYEYNRAEEDEVIKAKEDLENKKQILLDIEMQEANLIDEIELLKLELECKKKFCQVAMEQALSYAERDYKIVLHERDKLKREVKEVVDNLLRMAGY